MRTVLFCIFFGERQLCLKPCSSFVSQVRMRGLISDTACNQKLSSIIGCHDQNA